LSYKQQDEIKSNKSNMPTRRLRSFRDVTRQAGARRDASKRKIKRRDLDRLRSNGSQGSADAHHNADPGLRGDDSLPRHARAEGSVLIPAKDTRHREARRIAANIAELPELLKRPQY
jgi:hypothetical protein